MSCRHTIFAQANDPISAEIIRGNMVRIGDHSYCLGEIDVREFDKTANGRAAAISIATTSQKRQILLLAASLNSRQLGRMTTVFFGRLFCRRLQLIAE